MIFRSLLIIVIASMLAACGGGYTRPAGPAEVEERAAPRTSGTKVPLVAAYTPAAQPRVARAAPKRAVAVLMRRAQDQRRAGDLDAANVSLERALRISPDDALLWHQLAGVRLAQKNYALVTQLAAKSNALAVAGDMGLRADNWWLIAQARRAQGDAAGARAAEKRAASLR